MSREVSKGEEAAWALLRFLWGTAQAVVALTVAALLAEHLKRKADRGLLHWPFQPDRPIYLGGVAARQPATVHHFPKPERESQAAPEEPAQRGTPGTLDLSGLLGMGQRRR